MGRSDEITYVCQLCGADQTVKEVRHSIVVGSHDELESAVPVCLKCWQDRQPTRNGVIIPGDSADAPWQYHRDYMKEASQYGDGSGGCDCECHCLNESDLTPPNPDTHDGWLSVYEMERGKFSITILCRGCVDLNHGRCY